MYYVLNFTHLDFVNLVFGSSVPLELCGKLHDSGLGSFSVNPGGEYFNFHYYALQKLSVSELCDLYHEITGRKILTDKEV